MIRIFYLFFLSPPFPFLSVAPLLLCHFFFLSPPSSTHRRTKPLPSADRLRPTPSIASGLVDRSGFPHLHSAVGSWLCFGVRWYRGLDRCVVSTFG